MPYNTIQEAVIYPIKETASLCMPCPDPINTSCASARLILSNQQNIWAFMIGLIIGMVLVLVIFILAKKFASAGYTLSFDKEYGLKAKIEDDPQQTQLPSPESGEDKAQ